MSDPGIRLDLPRRENILKLAGLSKIQIVRGELDSLLRDTLIVAARQILSMVAFKNSSGDKAFSVADILATEFADPRKCKLAISFLRWCEKNSTLELSFEEMNYYKDLFEKVNKSLKSRVGPRENLLVAE